MRRMRMLVTLMAAVVMAIPTVWAQEKPKASEEPKPTVALKVQVVISEYEGERKISSLPYTFFLTDDNLRVIRMGLRVPVLVGGAFPGADPTKPQPQPQFQYMEVGTNIDCKARSIEGGRFRLDLSVDRSSLYSAASGKKPTDWGPGDPPLSSQPIVRQAKMSSIFPIRDGETVQAAMSTDPVSGRVLKVDVTANVVR
jgi:hypothetical protein